MSNLPWQTPYAHSQSSGGDSEIEALQTDVMRFMAILGLCLMAIFSLVQSLPYQPAEQAPQLESKELLEAEVKQLETNATELQEKIKQYTETLQQVQDANQQVQDAQKQVEDVKQKLEDIEQSVENQRGRLTQLNKTVQQEQQALSSIRKKLEREKRIHKVHKEKLKKIIKKQEPIKPQEPKKPSEPVKQKPVEQKPVESAKPKAEKKGFSLRFTSDQALLHLIQQQKINMYVLMGKNAWHIKPTSGSWQVKTVKKPKKYYQMAVQTVPNILRTAAQNQLSVHAKSNVIWAVELPQSIASSITQLMKNKQGGDLVITQNGQVELK